jgi:hypothetical protein
MKGLRERFFIWRVPKEGVGKIPFKCLEFTSSSLTNQTAPKEPTKTTNSKNNTT